MRVLVSTCSSFWISRKAVERARELDAKWAFPDHLPLMDEPQHHSFGEEGDRVEGEDDQNPLPDEVPRHDPQLLQVFDELGGEAMSGWDGDEIACLEIPDDVTYYVASYIGEWIAAQHRQWSLDTDMGGDSAGMMYYTFTKDSVFRPLGT